MVLIVKSDKIRDISQVPDRLTIRTKDPKIKIAILNMSDYLQIKNFSEVVRHNILNGFKAIKIKDEKQKELQEIADLFDLKVVDKYIRK